MKHYLEHLTFFYIILISYRALSTRPEPKVKISIQKHQRNKNIAINAKHFVTQP